MKALAQAALEPHAHEQHNVAKASERLAEDLRYNETPDDVIARLEREKAELLSTLESNLRDARTIALLLESDAASPDSMIDALRVMEKETLEAITQAKGGAK